MTNMESIGTVIARLRKDRNVTQDELAKVVGVSAQAVSIWENGGVPDTELLPKIADYFNISIMLIFARELIDKPNHFFYNMNGRKKPYFE